MRNALFSGNYCMLSFLPGNYVVVSNFAVRKIRSCFSSVGYGIVLFVFFVWVLILFICPSPERVVWWITYFGGRSCFG